MANNNIHCIIAMRQHIIESYFIFIDKLVHIIEMFSSTNVNISSGATRYVLDNTRLIYLQSQHKRFRYSQVPLVDVSSKLTPGKRQSKTLLTIEERGSKIVRNSVFDCHLSPVGRQMAIENSVSNDFFYLVRR